jgi:HPt (histidine-containing phosphotransfer) domain-containing protein
MPTLQTDQMHFNRQLILEQIGGDETLLKAIIEVFLVDSPDLRQKLSVSFQSGAVAELGSVAHCAKSAVGNFFAQAAVDAALQLENACKTNDTAKLEHLTHQLCNALINVEDVLRTELIPPSECQP